MPIPKTCADCTQEFDGRKTKRPHCAEAKAVTQANRLIEQREMLDEEGNPGDKSPKTPPPTTPDAAVMLELARSMQAMSSGMQSMGKTIPRSFVFVFTSGEGGPN